MTTLVLLSYGRENEYRRAILVIISFWGLTSDQEARVLIFTDRPDYFKPFMAGLPVEYILITPARMKVMKGEINFIHRMKIALIEEAFQHLKSEKLLYVDSDTYFQADPAPLLAQLSDKVSAMHMSEYMLEEFAAGKAADSVKARRFIGLAEKPFTTTRGQERFHGGHYSWNAGVLGLARAAETFLPDVYSLTDEIYKHTAWHASEQLAFSMVLQTRTKIIAASPYIFHYWPAQDKRVMDSILAEKITDALAQLPLAERLKQARQLVLEIPAAVERYVANNAEIRLQVKAMQAFEERKILSGYGYSVRAFLKAPRDINFIKHVLYHTKRQILGYEK